MSWFSMVCLESLISAEELKCNQGKRLDYTDFKVLKNYQPFRNASST